VYANPQSHKVGLIGDYDSQFLMTGQCTQSPGRIRYATGKLPYNRLSGHLLESQLIDKFEYISVVAENPFCENHVGRIVSGLAISDKCSTILC